MTFPLVNISRIPREKVSSFQMGFSDLYVPPDKDIPGDLRRRKKVRDLDNRSISLPLVSEVIKLAVTHLYVPLLQIYDIMPTQSYNNLL